MSDATFVSWAQNFEDVRLWRVLKGRPPGWYVDVGAYRAEYCSVTKSFYDRGWRGINVEPIVELADDLRAARPRDVTLAVLAGAEDGLATLHVMSSDDHRAEAAPGRSTVDPALVVQALSEGFVTAQRVLPVARVSDLLDSAATESWGRFDFLKVDVEGAELEVLRGIDFERHRPVVVLTEGPPGKVDALLDAAGYRFACFDVLNCWYVDSAHPETAELIAPPINVLSDQGWVTADHARALALQSSITPGIGSSHAAGTDDLEGLRAHVEALQREIEALRLSRSWRITAPLRRLSTLVRR